MKSGNLASFLHGFFTDRLMHQRRASLHTIASYRDTFRLLLGHAQQQLKKAPAELAIEDLDAPFISAFPECEHIQGDMRSLRLGRSFDAVLVHDAVMYMTSEDDLLAAARTAFEHTRPGGAAVFAPDCVRETFRESTVLLSGQDDARALRGLEWSWDPDPEDDTTMVEYVFLLREGQKVRAVHDRHVEGLFPASTWRGLLMKAGYEVETFERPLDGGGVDEVFLCRRRSPPSTAAPHGDELSAGTKEL
jgi:hypothetical protein